jgi:glutaredoxin 3
MSAHVLMYTTAVCPYCTRAKLLLKARGVTEIEEVRIDLDPAPDEMMHKPAPYGTADLYRGHPCRRLRRPGALDGAGKLRPSSGA